MMKSPNISYHISQKKHRLKNLVIIQKIMSFEEENTVNKVEIGREKKRWFQHVQQVGLFFSTADLEKL